MKVTLRFRGREMAHKDVGREVLNAFFEKLEDAVSYTHLVFAVLMVASMAIPTGMAPVSDAAKKSQI